MVDHGQPQPTGYVAGRFKTHPGMLLQFQALEVLIADTVGATTKRIGMTYRPATFPRKDGFHARVEEGKRVIPKQKPDLNFFSDSDIECLDEAINQYGKLSFAQLTHLSHDQAWEAADENDIIDLEQIIATFPDGSALPR